MQEACKKCGYESPEADKFCRQCGDQLSAETEFTAAVTLNHGRVEPQQPMASVGTGRLAPSIGDTIAGDTERYYSPPQYAAAQANIDRPPAYVERPTAYAERPTAYALINPPPPSRFKSFSGFMKGLFMFLLVAALLVTTGIAVRFSMEAEQFRRELRERERSGDGREQADGRAQNAWDQMEEALRLAHRAAEKAASAGATLAINGEKPIDLSKYAYPNAQVEAMIDSHGNEALSLLATDNFDDVQKFYERLLGKPVLQVAVNQPGNQRKKLLYQSTTLPSVLVKVEEIEKRKLDRDVIVAKITILHTFLRFPRFNEQAQNLR
jgi:hypothetical protein